MCFLGNKLKFFYQALKYFENCTWILLNFQNSLSKFLTSFILKKKQHKWGENYGKFAHKIKIPACIKSILNRVFIVLMHLLNLDPVIIHRFKKLLNYIEFYLTIWNWKSERVQSCSCLFLRIKLTTFFG